MILEAGGDDEEVVGDRIAVGEQDSLFPDVEVDHLAENDRGIRRHLVEERLEEVEVAAVDDRDLDRRLLEPAGGVEAAEPAAHDDDSCRFQRASGQKRAWSDHARL